MRPSWPSCIPLTQDPVDWLLAALLTALWLTLVVRPVLKHRAQNRAIAARASALAHGAGNTLLLAYGSQTGFAANLSLSAEEALLARGIKAHALPLSELEPNLLAQARKVVFVVSTTGEGDAPDNASGFVRHVMTTTPDLSSLNFGVLALGDSSYAQYCAFGRQIDDWLTACGARPLFARIEVDSADTAALTLWQQTLSEITGAGSLATWSPAPFVEWQLVRKTLLNPRSPGGEAWHLMFQPVDHSPDWQAGDIAEFQLPKQADDTCPVREYSLASLPSDGAAEFCVRLMTTPDGSPGLGSGWLIHTLEQGHTVQMRIRPNPQFRPAPDHAPVILIGNGTGIAGLRAHLKVKRQGDNWLLFGERTSAHDRFFGEELKAMQATGDIARIDLAFSRDEGDGRYVQHLLSENARDILSWVERGAYIFVCGSLEGMSKGVHAALQTILGEDMLAGLTDAGRYRRDVY